MRDATTAQPACTAAAGLACAPVNTIDGVLADPQTLARGVVVEQDHPVPGRVRLPNLPNLPFRFSDCEAGPRDTRPRDTRPRDTGPLIGEHDGAVAAALGYAREEIATMEREGVLYADAA